MEDGLQLILRRRLYIVGIAFLDRLALADEDLARVGRPENTIAIVMANGAILRELKLLAVGTSHLMDYHVVAFNPSLEFTIGRSDQTLFLLLVDLHPVALRLAEGSSPPLASSSRGRSKTVLAFLTGRTNGSQGLVHLFLRRVFLLRVFICIKHYKALSFRCLHRVMKDMRRVDPPHVLSPVVDVLRIELRVERVGTVVVVDSALG